MTLATASAAIALVALAAPAVSACPLGIDAHLTNPRGSPFLAKPSTVPQRIARTANLSRLTVTGLSRRLVHRYLQRADLASCLTLSPATVTVTVTFHITCAGLVTNLLVASTDPAATACLQTLLGSLRMPASKTDTFVDVAIAP